MKYARSLFILAALPAALSAAFAQAEETAADSAELDTVYVTAERQLQQSLGVSKISASDIDKRPPVNDLSEIIRTMPGVNLTGNTSTGQRGNKRQPDIRGMGPENTLILIDGKPVTSRNAERISMRGERNTRGDSNWVPAEAVESVTVLRGPAAARYGSGAMGGVINIVTKKITNRFEGSVSLYTNQPQDDAEGATKRIGFNLSGPVVKDVLSFRLYGSAAKTDADAADINAVAGNPKAAGVEGVRNRDIAGRLHWRINPEHSLTFDASYSRQGNIYNGDTQNSNGTGITAALLAGGVEETARLYRRAFSLTHTGAYGWGDSKTWFAYDTTTNSRMPENMAGGPEGSYKSMNFTDSVLKNSRFNTEWYIPFKAAGDHVLTVGAEVVRSSLNDTFTISYPGLFGRLASHNTNDTETHETSWAVFAEDNWGITEHTRLIPTLRFDHHSKSGNNLSGGLNFEYLPAEHWKIKGGIARAYKAPNLYQSNPNFLLDTQGNGCPLGVPTLGANHHCYFIGNAGLKPETSWNKEIGFEFLRNGWQVSLNYFHNDYRNKIVGDDVELYHFNYNVGSQQHYTSVIKWTNSPKALIAGVEGNLLVPLHDTLSWSTNFTYMAKSEDYQGNPLSLVPKHTINSTLSWTPDSRWDANLTFTHYGRIKPRSVSINRLERRTGLSTTETGSYGIWGINAGYRFNRKISARFGISNIFDKQLYRTNDGAQTFNEHGRAFYGSLNIGF